jgi:DNA-binding MarR family transcriptional regulator
MLLSRAQRPLATASLVVRDEEAAGSNPICLSLPEASALKRLDRNGPTSVTELAKAEQISVQSMGTTLRALKAHGLVERHSHPGDGRRSVLSITKSGTRVLGDKHTARAEQLAKALSTGFSLAELRQLMVAAPLIERLAQSL